MADGTIDVRVRFAFSGLPIEELRVYRSLRKAGLDRFLTNIAMYGRWTVHKHGTCDMTPVGLVDETPEQSPVSDTKTGANLDGPHQDHR